MSKDSTGARRSSTGKRGASRSLPDTATEPAAAATLELRLYVAMGAPNSERAVANLEALRREYADSNMSIEVVDVFQEPARAQADAVLLTPMLVKAAPGQTTRILGTLEDTPAVLAALGLLRA